MAKFRGVIGFVKTDKTSPGVWTENRVEQNYSGDIIRNSKRWQTEGKVNEDLVLNNQISIVADSFAYQNVYSMKYVEWMGTYWKITNIDVLRPRLILTIGGVYNGKTGPTPVTP